MWHVAHGEKQFGPFSEEKMLGLIKAGKLPSTVHVWKQGTDDWILLRDSSLMQPASQAAAPMMAEAMTPVAAANPFEFAQPAVQNQPGAAAINVAAAPHPTSQQLANPYFSDYRGGTAPAHSTATAAANPDFRLLPLQGRQSFVIGTTAFAGIMSIACAWSTFQQTELMKRMASGTYRNNVGRAMADANASDAQFLVVFLIFMVAMLAMSIAFLMWFYRAHVNAKAMSLAKFTDTSGWAVGCFFIPLLNLFKPYVGMRDIWRGSFSAPGSYAAPAPTLVGIWWASWIGMNFLNRMFIFSFAPQRPSPSDLVALSNIAMIGNILMLVPLGLTLFLVTKITTQQTRKAQQILRTTTQPQQQSSQPQIQLPQF